MKVGDSLYVFIDGKLSDKVHHGITYDADVLMSVGMVTVSHRFHNVSESDFNHLATSRKLTQSFDELTSDTLLHGIIVSDFVDHPVVFLAKGREKVITANFPCMIELF